MFDSHIWMAKLKNLKKKYVSLLQHHPGYEVGFLLLFKSVQLTTENVTLKIF